MVKRVDLTGKKFGKLTVVGFDHKDSHRNSFWKCKCDCGNTCVVNGQKLKSGHIKSCGCLRKENTGSEKNIKDLTGMKFGRLTVVELDHLRRGAYWKCKCECGNDVIVLGSRLLSGVTKSCGCLKKEKAQSKRIDLTGRLFGRLRVLYYNKELMKWHCVCENDGNEVDVASGSLKSGRTKSCGCLHKSVMHNLNFIDITDKVFNNLKVIEFVGINNGKYYWKCLCLNCGKEHIVEKSKLGITKSCGCLDIAHIGSSSENDIIQFIHNKFPDLNIERHNKNVLGGKEIDIYIPEKKLGIEYNGSAFHASENGIYSNKDKYYHRDKFLLARENGIHLVTIFDIDYINNKYKVLEIIRHLLSGNKSFFIPQNFVEYTNNDYDTGEWLKKYGYTEVGQLEPENFKYGRFTVYRCGKTKWILNKEEFLDGKSSI